jgi:penicillin amidase
LLRNLLLFVLVLAGLTVVVGGIGVFVLHGRMKASLPVLDGSLEVDGLTAEVRVERDGIGVPRIVAASRDDLARAIGFVHAQERFFQMDLMRRGAAGEMSALLGAATVDADRSVRRHRFRERARRNLDAFDDRSRRLLQSYTEGVNAGLAALSTTPPEYQILRMQPAPWSAEDSVLVVFAMYLLLQDELGVRESSLGLLYEKLPVELADFLAPRGTPWDAPLTGGSLPEPPLPGPEVFDARSRPDPPTEAAARHSWQEIPAPVPGSNNWAVAGTHTASGVALVANDMHLGMGLPNTWYRASLEWTDGERSHRVAGVTLAGTPAVIAGSNGRIAWGFTNSQGDWGDLIVIEPDGDDQDRYLTPDGPRAFERIEQEIEVKGGEPVVQELLETIWGPVIDTDHADRRRVVRWVAHETGAANFDMLELELANNVDEALELAPRCGIPQQNLVVGDSEGRIGWTIIGRIPRRIGFSGRVPTSWADGTRYWDGWLPAVDYPRVVDPASGRLWTANHRTVDGEALIRMGDGGYAHASRARQIRDALMEIPAAVEADMLAVQLDDRALFLESWRERTLQALTDDAVAGSPRRNEFRERLRGDWSGRASVDSVGYRLVRAVHRQLAREVFNALTEPCGAASERFRYFWIGQWDGPLWRLVEQQPSHLLPRPHESWDEAILAAIDTVLDELLDDGETTLERRTWGERNTVHIQHPLSRAVPQLSRWLDVPPQPLPGDSRMPRVQTGEFGSSERFAVSPGAEDRGFLHMPGGQSGHFLSPFYRAGHDDWADGVATPFLPGPAMHTLVLTPASVP